MDLLGGRTDEGFGKEIIYRSVLRNYSYLPRSERYLLLALVILG
jgi:hypothetical protein